MLNFNLLGSVEFGFLKRYLILGRHTEDRSGVYEVAFNGEGHHGKKTRPLGEKFDPLQEKNSTLGEKFNHWGKEFDTLHFFVIIREGGGIFDHLGENSTTIGEKFNQKPPRGKKLYHLQLYIPLRQTDR